MSPGWANSGLSKTCRYLIRSMPSVRLRASPSGNTSTSLAVKSVSAADVAAYSTTRTGPVTSRSCFKGALEYTRTYLRFSTGRGSRGPQGGIFGSQHTAPPCVGTGLRRIVGELVEELTGHIRSLRLRLQ